ncbi:MAG TPA: carbamoyltransferase C-terminal domain-containing protein [Terracidiphilus sp.]|nr:carbamoyltransferase C-terminal domain-containing protein [Terracidiphilus sp.]
MPERTILGLATMGESAAAIIIGGRLVAAVEEERISRRKHDGAFPYGAIAECLRIASITFTEIDDICVYWQPWRLLTRAAYVAGRTITHARSARDTLARVGALFTSQGHSRDEDDACPQLAGRWDDLFRLRSLLTRRFGPFSAHISFLDHHDCHAASGRLLLPYQDAICVTYDGGGEEHSTVVSYFAGNRLATLQRIRWPNSLGHYYSTFTGYLGFQIGEGEYMMMGLASFGSPKYADVIREQVLSSSRNGGYSVNHRVIDYHAALQGHFTDRMIELFGPPRASHDPVQERHSDIAASAQAAFEASLFDLLRWSKLQRPQARNLILAGGCALNGTANGKIVDSGLFDRVAVPPAPHDAGCAIGAALIGAGIFNGAKSPATRPEFTSQDAYLGSAFSNSDVESAFAAMGLPLPQRLPLESLIASAADALVAGEVIAWFQGASEFGPRALGNRSFLADPRSADMRERLNVKIKLREPFRPFAPSVKAESAAEYFNTRQPSPYMNIVSQVRPEKRQLLGAVTHCDGSARVHTVAREVNERYWLLIDAFQMRTGVPVLLNTSFNIQEPIVNTPAQAIATFLSSRADKLFINDFVCDDRWRAGATPNRPFAK